MSESFEEKIIKHISDPKYRPLRARKLARALELADEKAYSDFRSTLRAMTRSKKIAEGPNGTIIPPPPATSSVDKPKRPPKTDGDSFVGTYRHNRRGFGFIVPTDPAIKDDLFVPPNENGGALGGDIVRAMITSRGSRDGKPSYTGRVIEIIERKSKRFVGALAKIAGEWVVHPEGNTLTEPILTPDAASRHIRVGTKVVVELTSFPENGQRAAGVITEILGAAGEKDVDLKSVIVQLNLPEKFPEPVRVQARQAVDSFDPETERASRLDLTGEIICTIDPDDAKDYDDAISLKLLGGGAWELGVHIADVSFFVPKDSPLDVEARERGNSTYFPGFVIPMLPEILSNGVCSLQEGVPRLCKSAFITYDEHALPIATRFANTIINSRQRLRYREAQAILDGKAVIPHPQGDRTIKDYPDDVVALLRDMNDLAHRLQARRRKQGQINLELPEVELVLDEDGKVIDAVPEDTSFTHTLIEMFMVEANEAVARLLNSIDVPFLRRTHPEPDLNDSARLKHFTEAAGHRLPRDLDRKVIQQLLEKLRGKPESFAVNMAVLRSLTRAEYSPKVIGHYALASEHYAHFTSPIRRYADLTIHRLLDAYFEQHSPRGRHKKKMHLDDVPTFRDLIELGRHISFTERRSEEAERELRQVKLLELLSTRIGDKFKGVVSGVTGFGIFVQLSEWLIDGLIRYDDMTGDWWDVDERHGVVRGQRTGQRISIGDLVEVIIARVDVPRRELVLAFSEQLKQRHEKAKPKREEFSSRAKHRPRQQQKQRKRR